MVPLIQKIARWLVLCEGPIAKARKWKLRCLGATIGSKTYIPSSFHCTWPHQIAVGSNCVLQRDIFFNVDRYWTPGPIIRIGDRVFIGKGAEFNITCRLTIGNDSLIASGVKVIDHDHGMLKGDLMRHQPSNEAEVIIGNDVWIGANSILLKGVKISDGAVVGAGSVVTRSIPSYEIWAGIPAKKISERS